MSLECISRDGHGAAQDASMHPSCIGPRAHGSAARGPGRAKRGCLRNQNSFRCYIQHVTPSTLDAEPACPDALTETMAPPPAHGATPAYHAERRRVADIPQSTWDALAARTPWATPFSGWAFQRAWWDAYGANAHEETLIVCADGPGDEPIAIVPLMHRHEVEPGDALTHTTIRHGRDLELTPVEPTATAVFFGASYHADYATILAAPGRPPGRRRGGRRPPRRHRPAGTRGTSSTSAG